MVQLKINNRIHALIVSRYALSGNGMLKSVRATVITLFSLKNN